MVGIDVVVDAGLVAHRESDRTVALRVHAHRFGCARLIAPAAVIAVAARVDAATRAGREPGGTNGSAATVGAGFADRAGRSARAAILWAGLQIRASVRAYGERRGADAQTGLAILTHAASSVAGAAMPRVAREIGAFGAALDAAEHAGRDHR